MDNRGTWRVNMISNRGSVVTSTQFVVTDPANKEADLSVYKSASEAHQFVAAGSSSTFQISVQNNGPDPAQNVVLTDVVPANTTFVAMTQSSGPAFTCVTPIAGGTGTVVCTIASLARRLSLLRLRVYSGCRHGGGDNDLQHGYGFQRYWGLESNDNSSTGTVTLFRRRRWRHLHRYLSPGRNSPGRYY